MPAIARHRSGEQARRRSGELARIAPRALAAAALLSAAPLLLSAAAAPVSANDFPTQARVEFVLSCMTERGGQSYNNMYGCVCLVDRLANQYTYDEFVKTQTLFFLYSTPGERGGVFRDGIDNARARVKGFREHLETSEKGCFPKHVSG